MSEQITYYENKLKYEMDPADLFEALETHVGVVVIDARKPEAFERAHIPSAVNLPHRQMNEKTTAHLDRTKLYICYCDGIGCNASTRGALKMAILGFEVKELIGGLEWWKKDGYATEGSEAEKQNQIDCNC